MKTNSDRWSMRGNVKDTDALSKNKIQEKVREEKENCII